MFPIDSKTVRINLYGAMLDSRGKELGMFREYVIWFVWVGKVPDLLSWRMRCAVWNWMWNLSFEEQIDWRTRKQRKETI